MDNTVIRNTLTGHLHSHAKNGCGVYSGVVVVDQEDSEEKEDLTLYLCISHPFCKGAAWICLNREKGSGLQKRGIGFSTCHCCQTRPVP